jgi:hypothetical protein
MMQQGWHTWHGTTRHLAVQGHALRGVHALGSYTIYFMLPHETWPQFSGDRYPSNHKHASVTAKPHDVHWGALHRAPMEHSHSEKKLRACLYLGALPDKLAHNTSAASQQQHNACITRSFPRRLQALPCTPAADALASSPTTCLRHGLDQVLLGSAAYALADHLSVLARAHH